MKIDIKNVIILGTLLFTFGGFYYATTDDFKHLSIEAQGLRNENHDIRKRLDKIDKKLTRINHSIRELKNPKNK